MTFLRRDGDHDRVCESTGKHVLVVAPPGTGKTYLSVRLAGAIAPTLAASERVLLITFSNQARVRLEDEASRQLGHSARERVEVTNYHRFFWRAVRSYRRALGLPATLQIGSRARRIRALEGADKSAVKRLNKSGVLDALAEFVFPNFRDDRLSDEAILQRLLDCVTSEHQSGRLVFDDLGALFWQLLETYPSVAAAYGARYPVVIADEHQDASELQDAVVRRLGQRRLMILADPMQLIYQFRGSQPERLERHISQCDDRLELRTPHRWHGKESLGQWLQAVRARLMGGSGTAASPGALRIVKTAASYRLNGMKPQVKAAASRAFREGASTVAVLDAWNDEVAELRAYLSNQGLFPRQLGGNDFEDAREDIEGLPDLPDALSVARQALERLQSLVPTLGGDVVKQVERRLTTSGVNLKGKCGPEAGAILRALDSLYQQGASQYVRSLVTALDGCTAHGHHLPRSEAVRALREAATHPADDLNAVLTRYGETVVSAAQSAPRSGRGLFVMTAHQAKGKEFDAIVLVNATAAHFPDSDEGRRLFYVAITRASKSWTIIAPDTNETALLRHL